MNPITRRELIEVLLQVPATEPMAGRTSLLTGIPNHESLNRIEGNRRADLELIVDQLADVRLQSGEPAIFILVDNALSYLVGLEAGVTLQALRERLISSSTALSPDDAEDGAIVAENEVWGESLLPYLCDRSSQEDALDIALQRHREHTPRRPFICVVHGNATECHDKFKERLQEYTLPKLLVSNDSEQYAFQDYFVNWPSQYISKRDFTTIFHRNLAEKVASRAATAQEITVAISHDPAPYLVFSYLSTVCWEEEGMAERIRELIAYWESFPDLPLGPRLVYCLFLTHKTAPRKSLINKNRALKFFDELGSETFAGMQCVVLPELSGIGEEEVKNWIRDDRIFRDFCPAHAPSFCQIRGPLRDIAGLYQNPQYADLSAAEPRIPMELLEDHLITLIKKHRCPESNRHDF